MLEGRGVYCYHHYFTLVHTAKKIVANFLRARKLQYKVFFITLKDFFLLREIFHKRTEISRHGAINIGLQ